MGQDHSEANELDVLTAILGLVLSPNANEAAIALDKLRAKAAASRVSAGALKRAFETLRTDSPTSQPGSRTAAELHQARARIRALEASESRLNSVVAEQSEAKARLKMERDALAAAKCAAEDALEGAKRAAEEAWKATKAERTRRSDKSKGMFVVGALAALGLVWWVKSAPPLSSGYNVSASPRAATAIAPLPAPSAPTPNVPPPSLPYGATVQDATALSGGQSYGASADELRRQTAVAAFQAGLADRTELERWFASLAGDLGGDYRSGALYWAAQRSLQHPGPCTGHGDDQDAWASGCFAAKQRFAPTDVRRKSEPDYRAGWNVYSSSVASRGY